MPNIDNINANADKLNNQINNKVGKTTPKIGKGKTAVLDKKKSIFAKIAAAKAMIGRKKNKLTKSTDSINNKGNALAFISDLIKSLIGSAVLIDVVVNFLTNNMQEVEDLIKNSLKDELKRLVSCSVNPTIPDFLTTRGIIIETSKIDFLELFKTDPNSKYGSLMYRDITSPLTNSTDFNTFLYGVIQDDGTQHTWDNMLDITFNSVGAMVGTKLRPNNALTIKLNPNFSLTKLPALNNSFISKGKLIDTEKIINKTIDTIYGSVSSVLQKSLKQLQTEAQINDVIDRMVEADSQETIDDGYFSFSNEEINNQQESATWRKKGILKLECCNKVPASIPPQMLLDMNSELASATVYNKSDIVKSNINRMAEQNTSNSNNPEDDTAIKLDFIQKIIDTMIKSIASAIISPKIIFIFLINFKIVYGESEEYADAIDFMKLSRNLFKLIIKKITEKFMKEMIKVALFYIGQLTAEMAIKRQIEKAKDKKTQLLSLTGVPQEILRLIKGLVSNNNSDNSTSNLSTVSGVLNTLLSAFSIPQEPISALPPPLIMVGSYLRPGLSAKMIASRIVSRQSESGRQLGDIFADGPNVEEEMEIIRIEEIINALLTESVVNVVIPPGVSVTTTGIGNLGIPVVTQGATTSMGIGNGIIR
jgi:hypothetical protein